MPQKEQRAGHSSPSTLMGRTRLLRHVWGFMRVRKKIWLAPIIIIMLVLSTLLVLAHGSALAPFIYTFY